MKKIYLILSLVCSGIAATAQDATAPDASEKKQHDIQALKAALITKELDLTPDEAQKFWPVYNQYEKEMAVAIRESKSGNDDILDSEQRVLDIRKKYKDQFTKVLGNQQRMNRLFNSERNFRKVLIRALQQRQMKKGLRNNRPIRN